MSGLLTLVALESDEIAHPRRAHGRTNLLTCMTGLEKEDKVAGVPGKAQSQ